MEVDYTKQEGGGKILTAQLLYLCGLKTLWEYIAVSLPLTHRDMTWLLVARLRVLHYACGA